MGSLPSRIDKLLDIIEVLAQERRISLFELARRLNTHVGSIRIYIEYLEQMGVVDVIDGRPKIIELTADGVIRVGQTMILIYPDGALIFKCPFRNECPYYKEGCAVDIDKCRFMQQFLPALAKLTELADKSEKSDAQKSRG